MAVARNNATEFAFCTQVVDPPGYYNAPERIVAAVWLLSFMHFWPHQGYAISTTPLLTFLVPAATYCSGTTALMLPITLGAIRRDMCGILLVFEGSLS
jgi:hypothetical protein